MDAAKLRSIARKMYEQKARELCPEATEREIQRIATTLNEEAWKQRDRKLTADVIAGRIKPIETFKPIVNPCHKHSELRTKLGTADVGIVIKGEKPRMSRMLIQGDAKQLLRKQAKVQDVIDAARKTIEEGFNTPTAMLDEVKA